MSQPIINKSEHYTDLVARQIEQYKETEIMHDLPPIFHYWSSKHNVPKFKNIIGNEGITSFYAGYFQKCLVESDSNFLISVGSGDSSIEISIVKELLTKNLKKFKFICLELSPILIEKARKNIEKENLGDFISAEEIDINSWNPNFSFAGVMAHHSLHHILDLELLFGIIKNKLAVNGRFLTCDMVGRNGHMRWPEALTFIRSIWENLPRKYKFNHQSNKYDNYFENWDCSTEGFEGIRAQDILPLLIKTFSFEVFYAYGNLIDVFIDRGFGPNYDPLNKTDTEFIDFIEAANEQLISDGIIKPTVIFAVMSNVKILSTKVYKNWTPGFCMRDPLANAPVYNVESFIKKDFFNINEEKTNSISANIYPIGKELKFTNNQDDAGKIIDGIQYLKYGWNNAEEGCVWSSCEDASLILPVEKSNILREFVLEAKYLVYHSKLFSDTIIEIFINGTIIKSYKLKNKMDEIVSEEKLIMPFNIAHDKKEIEIKFLLPNRRQPQYESGPDLRALGIGLITLKIC